jgi:uncharacterized protein (DUF2249 family)
MTPVIRFKRFDVRPVLAAGVEPYPEIRKRLDALKPAEGLTLIAPFLPAPLIEKLASEGYKSKVERAGAGTWIARFWREEN